MMKIHLKRYKLTFSIIFAILLIALTLFILFYKNRINVGVGDAFDKIKISENNGLNFLSDDGKYTLLLYMSEECGGCVKLLSYSEKLLSLYGENSQSINIAFLFRDDIPKNKLKDYGIPEEKCFKITGRNILDDVVPTTIILDKEKNIIYKDIDLRNAISYLKEQKIIDSETILNNAVEYAKGEIINTGSSKIQAIYFYMEGCPDCVEAENILSQDWMKENFELHYIYRQGSVMENVFVDEYKLFAGAFDIVWYPSFVIFTEDSYEIIGQMQMNELEEKLKSYLDVRW